MIGPGWPRRTSGHRPLMDHGSGGGKRGTKSQGLEGLREPGLGGENWEAAVGVGVL